MHRWVHFCSIYSASAWCASIRTGPLAPQLIWKGQSHEIDRAFVAMTWRSKPKKWLGVVRIFFYHTVPSPNFRTSYQNPFICIFAESSFFLPFLNLVMCHVADLL